MSLGVSLFSGANGERGLPFLCANVGFKMSEVERAVVGGNCVRTVPLLCPRVFDTLQGCQSITI